MTEHPELNKGRCHLFIPFKDNIAGKELSAALVSQWICTTIVDSHASLQNSRSIPGKVKAHEVHVVATLLQLFNKVDLQAVMKAGRWSSGGTLTSFYLRDLSHKLTVYGTPHRSLPQKRSWRSILLGEYIYCIFC